MNIPIGINPHVLVCMGSKSDFSAMGGAITTLEEFGVPQEVLILSAHRTPELTVSVGAAARAKGIRFIIAGAGGAAHLAGMIASNSDLPVFGVPIKSHSSPHGGMDAMLSTIQMPPGVPVGTLGVNGSVNAALLVIRSLSTYPDYEHLRLKLFAHSEKMKQGVRHSNDELLDFEGEDGMMKLRAYLRDH